MKLTYYHSVILRAVDEAQDATHTASIDRIREASARTGFSPAHSLQRIYRALDDLETAQYLAVAETDSVGGRHYVLTEKARLKFNIGG